MFRKLKSLFAGLLIFLFLLASVTAVAASSKISMQTDSSTSEQISVMMYFPVMEWDGAFELTLEYDPAVLSYLGAGCERSVLSKTGEDGAVTLKSGADQKGAEWKDRAVRISLMFRVLDYTRGTATIKCTPKDIYDQSGALAVSGDSVLTVTLKAPPSDITTLPAGSTDSSQTDSDFGAPTDNGTDSSVPTDIPSDTGTTDTVASQPSVTDSDVVSDTVSDQPTDSDSDVVSTDASSQGASATDGTSDASSDESSEGSTSSQEPHRVLPVPDSMEKGALFLLCGAGVVFLILGVMAFLRRR